jgi:hypothetical protein
MVEHSRDIAMQEVVGPTHASTPRAIDSEPHLTWTARVVPGNVGVHSSQVRGSHDRSDTGGDDGK